MFVHSFKNEDEHPIRNFFDEYYMPLVEIESFNALIDNKPFFFLFFFFFLSTNKTQTRGVWKTHRNVKKSLLYNKKSIRLFVSSKIL